MGVVKEDTKLVGMREEDRDGGERLAVGKTEGNNKKEKTIN